jgi:hypothetical protein
MGWRIPKVNTKGKIEGRMHLQPHKIKLYDDCLMIDEKSIPLQNIKDVYFRPNRIYRAFMDYEPVLYITLKNGQQWCFRGWKMRHEDEYRQIAEFLVDYIKNNR